MDKLRAGVQRVVGTPGRVFDMINRRAATPWTTSRYFVLDEADEMLSRGFKDQIYDVFQKLPPSVHVGLFSATMPADVLELTRSSCATRSASSSSATSSRSTASSSST